jgi:hypothetical protein
MRFGGILAAAAPVMLGSCSLPPEPVKACKDNVEIRFTRRAAELNLDALENVLLAVSTLKACPAARATVTGRVEGAERATPRLGAARAANVTSLLIKNGIDRSRITVRETGRPDRRIVAIEWK